MRAASRFEVKGWDEKAVVEEEGMARITRAHVRESLAGDLEGEATVEYTMVYGEGGSASYTVVKAMRGRLGGREGAFVLQGRGAYDAGQGVARGELEVVPGSGRGGLAGLTGRATFSAGHQPPGDFTLEYELPA